MRTSGPTQHARQISRILALQPRMAVADLAGAIVATRDPAILGAMTNLVRVWAWKNKELPADFSERATVTAVTRQPVIYVAVDLERCARTHERVNIPLMPGRPVDARPLPTDDSYALAPLAPPSFATQSRTERTALSGGEEAVACSQCSGAGATACRRCSGGRVSCPSCGGALRMPCPRCGGAGTHLGVSGRMIQCQQCRTRGTVTCDRCAQQGTVSCAVCSGHGTLQCDPCAGSGNILRIWELVETRRTDHRRRPLLTEQWAGDWDAGFEQSDVVAERIVTMESDRPVIELDSLASPVLRQHAAALLREALDAHATERRNGHATDRVIAARVRLRGLYGYDVRLDYDGNPYRVFVAGGGTIMPCHLPATRRGPIASGIRLIKRYLRALQTDVSEGPQEAFVRAVRNGQAHISDDAFLLPQVAARIGMKIEVTEEGYRCYVRDQTGGETALTVGLDVRFDLNPDDERILCVDADLGEGQRDGFARLLAACHDFPIGRLAIVDAPDGTERLRLVDRRPYGSLDVGQYAGILTLLATMSRRLRGSEALG
jgi:hypothetical protein